jgi:cytosine/adenosine deaminase-related metal-dependent hydrolase
MLLLPGLINGHLHTWQTGLRGIAADWTVAEYMQAMHRGLATLFHPEDIYIANLMGALNQINNGATTLVDWCHNNPTPEHTDAAIQGLDDSGIRALFLHGSPKPGSCQVNAKLSPVLSAISGAQPEKTHAASLV